MKKTVLILLTTLFTLNLQADDNRLLEQTAPMEISFSADELETPEVVHLIQEAQSNLWKSFSDECSLSGQFFQPVSSLINKNQLELGNQSENEDSMYEIEIYLLVNSIFHQKHSNRGNW